MKLTAKLVGGQPVGTVVTVWSDTDLSGDPAFRAEDTVSTGYQEITSIENWHKFGTSTGLKLKKVKAEIKALYDLTTWDALNAEQKKAVAFNSLVDAAKRDEVLNATEQADSISSHIYGGVDETFTPSAIDDESQGYVVGSEVISGGNLYKCIDNTDGAAVWKKISLVEPKLLPVAFPSVTSGTTYTIGIDAHTRIKRTINGNSSSNTSYASVVLPDDFDSFPSDAFGVFTMRNHVGADLVVTIGKNGTPDSTINALSMVATSTSSVWELKTSGLGSSYSAGDILLITLVGSTSNGTATFNLGIMKFKYNSK